MTIRDIYQSAADYFVTFHSVVTQENILDWPLSYFVVIALFIGVGIPLLLVVLAAILEIPTRLVERAVATDSFRAFISISAKPFLVIARLHNRIRHRWGDGPAGAFTGFAIVCVMMLIIVVVSYTS